MHEILKLPNIMKVGKLPKYMEFRILIFHRRPSQRYENNQQNVLYPAFEQRYFP